MIRRYLINPVHRWLGLPVHYCLKAKTIHIRAE